MLPIAKVANVIELMQFIKKMAKVFSGPHSTIYYNRNSAIVSNTNRGHASSSIVPYLLLRHAIPRLDHQRRHTVSYLLLHPHRERSQTRHPRQVRRHDHLGAITRVQRAYHGPRNILGLDSNTFHVALPEKILDERRSHVRRMDDTVLRHAESVHKRHHGLGIRRVRCWGMSLT